jgi:hypothetical protein
MTKKPDGSKQFSTGSNQIPVFETGNVGGEAVPV